MNAEDHVQVRRTKRPFFIDGTPRSGTTLLQTMLTAGDGLYIAPETHFLPLTKFREKSYGRPQTDTGFENHIRQILSVSRRHELPVDLSTLKRELHDAERSYGGLFDTLLWHIQSRQPDCRRVGEKSPGHLLFVADLLEIFPDAKVITVIRDGRDVALSQREAWGTLTGRAALAWRRDQRLHNRYAKMLPGTRYTWVRYEDLVNRPQDELRRLCHFLEEPFNEAMIRFHDRTDKGFPDRETHKEMTLRPLTAARVGRYRNHLTESQIAVFQLLATRELQALGYGVEPSSRMDGYLAAARELPVLLWERAKWRRSIRRVHDEAADQDVR